MAYGVYRRRHFARRQLRLVFGVAAAGTTISLNAGAWAAWSSQSPQAALAAGLTSPAWASWAGQATQNALSAGLASGTITAWAGQSTQNTATNSVAAGSVAAWSGQGTQNAVTTDLNAGSMGFTSQVISVIGNLVLDLGSAAMSFVAGTVSTAAAAVVAGMRGMILNIGRLLNR